MNNKGDPYAFCIEDIVFFWKNGRTIVPHKIAVKDRSHVYFTKKCCRWQKNGEHGIKCKLTQNTSHLHLCPVKNWLDIIERFLRLVNQTVRDQLLAIYKCEQTKKVPNICFDDSKKLMQYIVRKTYNITDKKELKKFMNHSLQVGPCCILQAQKQSDSFIRNALR